MGEPATIINVYAPTQAKATEDPEIVLQFYESLNLVIDNLSSIYGNKFIVTEDFNARVGVCLVGKEEARGEHSSR